MSGKFVCLLEFAAHPSVSRAVHACAAVAQCHHRGSDERASFLPQRTRNRRGPVTCMTLLPIILYCHYAVKLICHRRN